MILGFRFEREIHNEINKRLNENKPAFYTICNFAARISLFKSTTPVRRQVWVSSDSWRRRRVTKLTNICRARTSTGVPWYVCKFTTIHLSKE